VTTNISSYLMGEPFPIVVPLYIKAACLILISKRNFMPFPVQAFQMFTYVVAISALINYTKVVLSRSLAMVHCLNGCYQCLPILFFTYNIGSHVLPLIHILKSLALFCQSTKIYHKPLAPRHSAWHLTYRQPA
jgi:hypothetical protein